MQIINKKIKELIPYKNNPRINKQAISPVMESIKEFGFKIPIIIDENNVIICGHTRYEASKKLKLKDVPCIIADDLSDEQIRAFRLADNKVASIAEWDIDLLGIELEEIEIDMSAFGFEDTDEELEQEDETEIQEDEPPEVNEIETISKLGDVWQLGNHRLICGDSTDRQTIKKLMGDKKAKLVFTDPPYGMKKEADGVLNDNLNFEDLLEFNKKWIPITFEVLDDVGSWYCWGIDEPLMDIYSEILKPMKKNNELTFRNLITWNKGHGQGQMSDTHRMYATADEKCLFVMKGVQGFNTNSENYFEKWEPIREYLYNSRIEMGWDVPTMKKIVGHSDLSRDHWTSKSQWSLIPEYCYQKLQEEVRKEEQKQNKEYSAFKKEYEEIKKEYEEIKKEYYSTRAYFNNTHDNMNNVWHIERTHETEKEYTGEHATPKPLKLCERAIKTSSRKGELILDVFGGSGSTLIACEQLERVCYMVELQEKYADVIIKRWENLTGRKAKLIESD